MSVLLLFSTLFQYVESQDPFLPLFGTLSQPRSAQSGFGLANPLGDLLSLFSQPNTAQEKERFESVNDYDDQIVHSKHPASGHRSSAVRPWSPFSASSSSSHSSPISKKSNVNGPGSRLAAPRIKAVSVQHADDSENLSDYDGTLSNQHALSPSSHRERPRNMKRSRPEDDDDTLSNPHALSSIRQRERPGQKRRPSDYDDTIDVSLVDGVPRERRNRISSRNGMEELTPFRRSTYRSGREGSSDEEDRPSRHSYKHRLGVNTAPVIRTNAQAADSFPEDDDWTNLESEISTFSTVHQSPNGNYRNVQKIMSAFKSLMVDPNKPRKIVMADDSEIGRNLELAPQLFESDIVLTVAQMKGIVLAEKETLEGRRRHKRKVITGGVYRWADPASLPYRLKDNDPEWKSYILEGIRLWESETCLKFHENYGVRDHILFYKGSGCFSSVGKTGGSQMISIGKGCLEAGIIAHEIAHSLGFWHEQSRPDRDYYIRIRREFVASGSETNFLKSSYREADSMGLPYDLGSIMHYGPEAFTSRHGEITVESLNARYESTIGQRQRPSFIDIKQMNRLYCNDKCAGMQLACRHGGYPDPANCQKCKCPDGLSGPICDEIQGECGSELIASRGWQQLKHEGRGDCVWRIRTTNGKVRLRLSRVEFDCKRTCEHYVEVKSAADFQQTGFRTCCPEEWSVVSEGEEVLIIVRSSKKRINSMKVEYVRVNSLTEEVDDREKEASGKAPAIKKWVPGQENRGFRGTENGPVEKFILDSIGALRHRFVAPSFDFSNHGRK